MSSTLVLDANIIIRAVLGKKVREHLLEFSEDVDFFTPDICIEEAKQRMKGRDLDDWPVVATALLFNCPIWTEDKDFFGVGIPVWTTDRIHLFFDSLMEPVF